jgi:hypothetical protein
VSCAFQLRSKKRQNEEQKREQFVNQKRMNQQISGSYQLLSSIGKKLSDEIIKVGKH